MTNPLINLYSNLQEGASEADLSVLPKYRFQISKDEEKCGAGAGRMVPIETSSGYLANERLLLPEDAVCYHLVFYTLYASILSYTNYFFSLVFFFALSYFGLTFQ